MPGRGNERTDERGVRRKTKWAVGAKLGLGGHGGKAEFFELQASTYQGFFETKKTLFLETGLGWGGGGAPLDRSGQGRRKVLSSATHLRVTGKRRLMVVYRACLRLGK